MITEEEIHKKFWELCYLESDINQHMEILREYAENCVHITEMGVRGCVSIYAFLSSHAKKIVAIDILNVTVPDIEKLEFICADDLEIEIEPTEMLLIDTKHTYNQLKQELKLHSGKVSKYIAMHDVGIFGRTSDDGSSKGLMDALEEFLEQNKKWGMDYLTQKNNGLAIIKRK